MDTHQPARAPSGRAHPSPSLVAVASVLAGLFVASLVVTTALAGGSHFPSPFAPEGESLRYFAEHPIAVRVGAFVQFGAAIPLGIFAAAATSRLRFLGVEAAGTTIALFGGLAASSMLALSALVQWVISQPGVVASGASTHALHLLAFAFGGPGHVVPLGLLVAGIAASAGLHRRVPRWMMVTGLVIAGVAEISALALVLPGAMYALPAARFTALLWLVGAGAMLPKTRARRVEGAPAGSPDVSSLASAS